MSPVSFDALGGFSQETMAFEEEAAMESDGSDSCEKKRRKVQNRREEESQ